MEEKVSKDTEDQLVQSSDKSGVDDEADLIRQCLDGNVESFAVLVDRYQDRVFNVVLRMCRNRHDAEELTQEAFVRAFEKLGEFRGTSRFYTWLFRIATNQVFLRHRRKKKVKFISISSGDEDANVVVGETEMSAVSTMRYSSPDDAMVGDEMISRVNEAISELDEEFRIVVILRDLEDMDYDEISSVLDIPVGTVKSRLHRSRNMLKDKLYDLLE